MILGSRREEATIAYHHEAVDSLEAVLGRVHTEELLGTILAVGLVVVRRVLHLLLQGRGVWDVLEAVVQGGMGSGNRAGVEG